jgi:hypothetical protein
MKIELMKPWNKWTISLWFEWFDYKFSYLSQQSQKYIYTCAITYIHAWDAWYYQSKMQGHENILCMIARL